MYLNTKITKNKDKRARHGTGLKYQLLVGRKRRMKVRGPPEAKAHDPI
jgi:hypothetical protein